MTTPAGPGDDVVLSATNPPPGDDVLAPLRAYMRGHATGDPAHFREAFLPTVTESRPAAPHGTMTRS